MVTTVLQPITATTAHLNRTGDIDLMELVIYQKRQTQTNNHTQKNSNEDKDGKYAKNAVW